MHEMRTRLLDAASRVLSARGFAAATTRAIAQEAGVNEVTLFRHFGAKADLLIAAFEREVSDLVVPAIAYTGDLEADLTRLVRAYADFVRDRGAFLATVISELPRHPELQPAFAVPRQFLAASAVMLARYHEQGLLPAAHPAVHLATLLGPLLVLALVRQAAGQLQLADIDIDPADHVRQFLRGKREEV